MIESIHYQNFKALRDTTLPLDSFTLIVGPNGSGKSTAMTALQMARAPDQCRFNEVVTAGLQTDYLATVEITINWRIGKVEFTSKSGWTHPFSKQNSSYGPNYSFASPDEDASASFIIEAKEELKSIRIFSFDADALAEPVTIGPQMKLEANGRNLVGVLDNLRDSHPETFDALNKELSRWLPEFDRISFDPSPQGKKSLLLRTREGQHRIPAADLSQGTLFALAFLTLAYLPNPPSIVCFEEPEKGIHPRLLREIRDGMYRLCHPADYGDDRRPTQVIATTHSPYMLDLYKDHPEEVVIAHKDELGVHFERLSEKPNLQEFLEDAPLGEVWYSGILGGVPNQP